MSRLRSTVAVTLLAVILMACADAAPSPTTASTATPAATPAATPSESASPTAQNGEAGQAELLAAVDATVEQGTVRIEQTIEFEGSSVIPDSSASGAGQATFSAPRQMTLTADFAALGLDEMEMIRDGSLVYMRGAAFDDLIASDQWLLVDLESEDPAAAPFMSLASGENDISMAVYYLYGVTGPVAISDGDTIAGQAARHYEAEVDLEAARERIPEDHSDALEDLIANLRVAGIERQIAAEAWVGEDGLIHRLRYVYELGRAQGGGSMSTTLDLHDFGAPMELGIPAEADVVRIEDLSLEDG
jgi:hypothetical protein